jgi:hypothetical protein
MLLFTYVNLRLINKVKTELGDFLMQALESSRAANMTTRTKRRRAFLRKTRASRRWAAAAARRRAGARRRRAAAAIGTEPLRINKSKSRTNHRPEEE